MRRLRGSPPFKSRLLVVDAETQRRVAGGRFRRLSSAATGGLVAAAVRRRTQDANADPHPGGWPLRKLCGSLDQGADFRRPLQGGGGLQLNPPTPVGG
jgi:hypothetical protein